MSKVRLPWSELTSDISLLLFQGQTWLLMEVWSKQIRYEKQPLLQANVPQWALHWLRHNWCSWETKLQIKQQKTPRLHHVTTLKKYFCSFKSFLGVSVPVCVFFVKNTPSFFFSFFYFSFTGRLLVLFLWSAHWGESDLIDNVTDVPVFHHGPIFPDML